ncbi:hypothetical protein FA15DRAFT_711835 [Coprinopsis marcescibilis]|uniref:Uncharacterized protein n=1 Tax=Coprinopsis marcescibilis TaxID=230819 RepID=A0A5C3K8P4_COPMA|nr:hypothetical protein FA15DRAFT_711835 [Coprinopsis marcescibilis]
MKLTKRANHNNLNVINPGISKEGGDFCKRVEATGSEALKSCMFLEVILSKRILSSSLMSFWRVLIGASPEISTGNILFRLSPRMRQFREIVDMLTQGVVGREGGTASGQEGGDSKRAGRGDSKRAGREAQAGKRAGSSWRQMACPQRFSQPYLDLCGLDVVTAFSPDR